MAPVLLLVVLAATRTPVSEPVGFGGAPSGTFLLVSQPKLGPSPYAIRILGGFQTGASTLAQPTDLMLSTLAAELGVGKRLNVQLTLDSRAATDSALASMPDRLALRVLYVLPALGEVRLGALAGAVMKSDIAVDPPEGQAGEGFGGALAAGELGLFHWTAQVELAAGGAGGAHADPYFLETRAGLAVSASLPWWQAAASLEGYSKLDPRHADQGQRLALAGLFIPLAAHIKVHVAATAGHQADAGWAFGGVVAVSGLLGGTDLDADAVPDTEDACPTVAGSATYQGCVMEDQDKDRVWDRLDACLGKPGPARNAGCPLEDTDGDGVPDVDDACPERKECETP